MTRLLSAIAALSLSGTTLAAETATLYAGKCGACHGAGAPPLRYRARAARNSTARRSAQKLGQNGQPATNATWPPACVISRVTCGFARAASTGIEAAGTIGSSSDESARSGRRTPARKRAAEQVRQ